MPARKYTAADVERVNRPRLGIKIERGLGDTVAVRQLAEQLRKRFPDSRELSALERGAFND